MILRVAEQFSRTPGSRYESEGEFSGEIFRREYLRARLREAISSDDTLLVDLDGTAGFGTSFLEEAFGGLVREDGYTVSQLQKVLRFKSEEEPYLIEDIEMYLAEARPTPKGRR